MKTVFEHIEQVKGKPHHIRKRVAFTVAAGGAIMIAFVWVAGDLFFGVFALKDSSFADATRQAPVLTTSNTVPAGLAGAAAALEKRNAPAHIEIVDTMPMTPPLSEQTTLPF